MVKAIRVHEYGPVDVMRWEDIDIGAPGEGEVLIRHHAIGLNYIDVYFRSGVYEAPALPFVPGHEGSGEILEVGPGVLDFIPGERVAYVGPLGSYARERRISADRLVRLPPSISSDVAASIMLKGMTAHYLLHRTFKVKKGDTILFHAAAGGVGLLACQWARALGATVIGTVSTVEKAELARAHGCHHVVNYQERDFVAEISRLTGGRGVDVVYDGVGNACFPASLDCLKPLGLWVLFGASSGFPPPVDMKMLAQRGSLFATRPSLFDYIALREDLLKAARDLFEAVDTGCLRVEINQRYALSDAARAHHDLESRVTTGATLLMPQ